MRDLTRSNADPQICALIYSKVLIGLLLVYISCDFRTRTDCYEGRAIRD
jgi:hypothetical protein